MYIAESLTTPCQIENAKLWFAKPGTRGAKKAAAFCLGCPEIDKCLAAVVKFENKTHQMQRGIYGSLDMKQRQVLRRRLRSAIPA